MNSKLLLSLFKWFSINTVFHLEQHYFTSITESFKSSFNVSNLIHTFQTDWVESSTKYSLFIHNSYCIDYLVSYHPYCEIFLYQLSKLTTIYLILRFKSFSPTFLVAMSDNCITPPHHSILWIFQFSPFLTKCTLLEICLVCLVYLPLLSIQTADLIPNIIRGDSYGTISVCLLKIHELTSWNVLRTLL